MEYSIVIPAYNEADKISSTLTQIVNFMRSFSEDFEIIVVDDGSKDNTVSIVEDYKKENREVNIIKNAHKGKGYAVLTGVKVAHGNYIYLCDADLSTPISELKKLTVWAKEHEYDIVIASREGVGAQRVGEPFYRHLMGRIFNIFVQIVILPGIKDTQCGFKLFSREVVKKVFNRLVIYGENSKELKDAYMGAWDVEVLFIARKMGFKIKEVPVTWTYVKTTRLSAVRDSLRMIRDVIRIRFNAIFGKYKVR